MSQKYAAETKITANINPIAIHRGISLSILFSVWGIVWPVGIARSNNFLRSFVILVHECRNKPVVPAVA